MEAVRPVDGRVGLAVTLCRLVFLGLGGEGYSMPTSVGTTAILTENFRGFPQFTQANSGMVSQLCRDRFLPNSFPLSFYDSAVHTVAADLRPTNRRPSQRQYRCSFPEDGKLHVKVSSSSEGLVTVGMTSEDSIAAGSVEELQTYRRITTQRFTKQH
jgi:hypothetical protein